MLGENHCLPSNAELPITDENFYDFTARNFKIQYNKHMRSFKIKNGKAPAEIFRIDFVPEMRTIGCSHE